jgi:hypothetical protein
MDIYIFPSMSLRNIYIGIQQGMWAVAPIDEPYASARLTRSHDMPEGAAGLFYCSNPQVFTTPFRIESRAEDSPITGVWDETWFLPFRIRPLGDLSHQITLTHAKATWPKLEGVPNVTEVLNLSGAMAFTKTWFPRRNWDIILEQLHIDPEQFEDLFP